MWRISYRTMSLQDVLIMAYMNVLEPKSWVPPGSGRDVQIGTGNRSASEERHYQTWQFLQSHCGPIFPSSKSFQPEGGPRRNSLDQRCSGAGRT